MNETSAHLTPTIGVLATDNNDIGRHTQITQGAMKTDRLLSLVADLRLNNEKVDIAARTGLSASMGTKKDDLRVRSSISQAAPGLGNESLIDDLHDRNRSRDLRLRYEQGAARKKWSDYDRPSPSPFNLGAPREDVRQGQVRPGRGPRFLPRPIKTQSSDKTAAE